MLASSSIGFISLVKILEADFLPPNGLTNMKSFFGRPVTTASKLCRIEIFCLHGTKSQNTSQFVENQRHVEVFMCNLATCSY